MPHPFACYVVPLFKGAEMTDERIAQARRLRDEGKTYQAIADIIGLSCPVVYEAVNPLYAKKRHLHAAKYRKKHKEELRLYRAKYRKEHKEKFRLYRETHREYIREYARKYHDKHLGEYAARAVKRRALIAKATIGDPDQIKEIYRIAAEELKVRCCLCGKLIPMGARAVDHIFPISRDGAHRPSNLAVVHKKCNSKKGTRLPEEIGLLL